MDRELSMEFVRVTEAAAVACGRLIGKGDKNGADGLAVDAMRQMFDTVHISGTVVIGEGEMDEAPMLYIGEKVGAGGPEVDIAVDPVEGTNLTAKGQNGAIAVMAIAPRGCLLHAPDMYMDKIAVGNTSCCKHAVITFNHVFQGQNLIYIGNTHFVATSNLFFIFRIQTALHVTAQAFNCYCSQYAFGSAAATNVHMHAATFYASFNNRVYVPIGNEGDASASFTNFADNISVTFSVQYYYVQVSNFTI